MGGVAREIRPGTQRRPRRCRYVVVITARRRLLGDAVGGLLLGILSVFWLTKSANLIFDNARCCLFASEGDGRRGIFFAVLTGGIQLAALGVAVGVVQGRARRTALALIALLLAVALVLATDEASGGGLLWLNVIALVVAGAAIALPRRRSRIDRPRTTSQR